MLKIRQGVFETNSSSTHAFCISPDNTAELMDTIIPDEEGKVYLYGGQFGWEFEKYNDALTKANYIAIMVLYEKNETIKKVFEGVIKEQTGCNEVIIATNVDWNNDDYSYIDHSGLYDASKKIPLSDKEQLRQFIFNKNSWLCTGNDNSEFRWRMVEGKVPILVESLYD